jgi:hypothetical protein
MPLNSDPFNQFSLARVIEQAQLFGRGLRRSFTRDNIVANLKTLLGVAPLTILVWIYAEQQQLVTEKETVQIQVISSDPAHQLVSLLSPQDATVQVTLQGTQSGIDRVRQKVSLQPVEVSIGSDLPPGPRQLAMLDQLAGNRVFYSRGVTVVSCSPETLVVRADPLEDRKVPVKAPPDAPGLISAAFHPATVLMRAPSGLLDELRRHGKLVAVADLADEPVLQQPGEHDNITVHLMAQDNVIFVPATVSADLQVGQADQTLQVSPVPVKVLSPKWLMDNYKFDYKEVLTDPVTLVGPPQQIGLIDPRNAKLIAVVELDNNDATFHSDKPISYQDEGLPDGVHVKPDVSPRMIHMVVEPR